VAWLELQLHTCEEHTDAFESCLLENGALAITYRDAGDQPILEPDVGTMPLWEDIVLVALYNTDVNTNVVDLNVKAAAGKLSGDGTDAARWGWHSLEDRIWEREWLTHQKPTRFGNRFWVYHQKVDDALPTLLLDPGLAFGTGSHPTTALCLEWIAEQELTDINVLDYGCGSGILALAALLCGANNVDCVDIDPQALQATLQNLKRNEFSTEALSVYFPNNAPRATYSCVLANILSGPLTQLAPTLAGSVKHNGLLCLSGILAQQEDEIVSAYKPWFSDITVTQQDDWLRITGKRNIETAPTENSLV